MSPIRLANVADLTKVVAELTAVVAELDVADSTCRRVGCRRPDLSPILLRTSYSSHFCAGQRLTPHNRTLEVRPGRITKKLELKYDYDCDDTFVGALGYADDVTLM